MQPLGVTSRHCLPWRVGREEEANLLSPLLVFRETLEPRVHAEGSGRQGGDNPLIVPRKLALAALVCCQLGYIEEPQILRHLSGNRREVQKHPGAGNDFHNSHTPVPIWGQLCL
jgi:hypothetical protein